MHRVLGGQVVDDNGVARLVVGGELPLPLDDHPALLLRPGDHLDHRLVELGHADEAVVSAGGQEGGLVHQVLQIGAGETAGALGQLRQGHVVPQGLVAGMDLQDGLPALDVGVSHVYLPVEAAGAQEGGVQDVLPVGGRHDHHALIVAEAVHLHQELVEGLLPLVVAAAQAGAALAAHGVDLVDKDDGGGVLLGLVKQVADAGGAHAHVELHKVGAGDGEEVNPRLAGHGLGQQGLAGARRAHQQHALGDAGPQLQKPLGVPEELHNLLELPLLLLGAGHVLKGDLLLLVGAGAGAGAAEAGGAVHTAAASSAPAGPGLAQEHEVPQQAEHHQDDDPRDKAHPVGRHPTLGIVVVGDDPLPLLFHNEVVKVLVEPVRVADLIGEHTLAALGLLQVQGHGIVLQGDPAHHLLLQQLAHLGIGDLLLIPHPAPEGEDGHQQNHGDEQVKAHIAQASVSFQTADTSFPGRLGASGARYSSPPYTQGLRMPM